MKRKILYGFLVGLAFLSALYCIGFVGAVELNNLGLARGMIYSFSAFGLCVVCAKAAEYVRRDMK